MKITVTRAHIEKGKPNYRKCPIALALKGCDFRDVAVRAFYVRIGRKVEMLGKRERQFIRDFDEGKPVKPFSFNLKVGK